MGYIDVAPPGILSSTLKTAYKAAFDEGLCYGADTVFDESERAATIKNMWLVNGVLTSRKKLSETGVTLDGGCVHSSIFCFGYELIHSGSVLYGIGNDGIKELYSGIPDKSSFFASFSGKVYLYCDTYVYSVDREITVKEEIPYCPVYSRNCFRSNGHAPSLSDFVPNILAPIAKIYYEDDLTVDNYKYHFPNIMDRTRHFYVYVDDELVDDTKYTIEGDYFCFTKETNPKNDSHVSICCYSNEAAFEKCGIIAGCKTAVSFGGGTVNGTRVIAAGNPDYPGRYFYSEIAQPLCFKEDLYGIAGDGTQDITAFSKQYSDLLVFTDSSVSRMRYNYTSENGGYFSVYMINSGIGCDTPLSVASVGNKTVFSNSKMGMFIVNSTENFDAFNIQPISRNITDDSGKNGFFGVSEDDRKKAVAAVYDEKLMLLCADRVFIWDFGNSPYVSSSDYVKAAEKLTWFEFDGFDGVKNLFSAGNALYALKSKDENMLSVYGFLEDGDSCTYIYKSANSALSYPFDEKYVLNFRADFVSSRKTSAKLLFYADGKLYYSLKAGIVPDADGNACFSSRIPKFCAKHFAFEIRIEDSDVGIADVGFDYIVKKQTKKYSR